MSVSLQIAGHACMILRDADKPILITDPWLIGSCYWRSWWLQNYPANELLHELSNTEFCYITHEHPDHFHLPSIRKLGKNPVYLSPSLPEEQIAVFLSQEGYTAKSIPARQWHRLSDEIEILSIPFFPDDSILLVKTPNAVLINFNDTKPNVFQARYLNKYLAAQPGSRKRIMMISYSPASIVNSFRKDNEVLTIRDKQAFVDYVGKLADVLNIDHYLPFASQAVFHRTDSSWANAFKVSYSDLEQRWNSKAELLQPFSTIDLSTFVHRAIEEVQYNHDPKTIQPKVSLREYEESEARFEQHDIEQLRKKMAASRWLLAPLFTSGIGFEVDGLKLNYSPLTNEIAEGAGKSRFTLQVPTQALKDVLTYGHFGDLAISMFTLVKLNRPVNPKKVFLFVLVIIFHDYHHTIGLGNIVRWVKHVIRDFHWSLPPFDSIHSDLRNS